MTFTGGVIFILVLLKPVYGQASHEIWSNDNSYQNITPVCPSLELCSERTDEGFLFPYPCQCDEMCSFYADCCLDSPFFSPSEELTANFICVNVPVAFGKDVRIKMIADCPPDAESSERRLCEQPDETSFLLGRIPITVIAKNISVVYPSVYCARCNGVANPDVTYLWNTTLVCFGHSSSQKPFPDDAEAVWDPRHNRYKYTEGNLTLDCDKKVILPDNWAIMRFHLRCPSTPYLDQCPEDWSDPIDARLCKGYTAQVKKGGVLYKNQHCVKCYGGKTEFLSCKNFKQVVTKRKMGRISTDYSMYSLILRYTRSECGTGAHYDAILKECVHLFPPRVVHQEKEVTPIDTCTRVTLSSNHFELSPDNITVVVSKYKRNFSQGHFRLTEDGRLEVCGKDTPQQPVTAISLLISMVTIVGLSLSIMFLLLHLCAIALVAELRNISGIILASLCVALLGAYTSFIVGSTLREKSFLLCYICAIITYVFFMASFFWTLVLAFDVSKVVRLSVRKLRSSRGFKWRRFTVYSIIAWGIPILLGVTAHWLDHADPGSVDNWFRPNFALDGCWFHSPNSLLVFFLIPLAVIMMLNFSFFVYAAVVTSENSTGRRQNLRLYVKLTILLGLNWIVGLLASALDNDVLWVIFSLLNTLQGLFIFLSFTLTSKVSRGLSKRIGTFFRKPCRQTSPECTGTDKETSFSTQIRLQQSFAAT